MSSAPTAESASTNSPIPGGNCPQPERIRVLHLLFTIAYGGVETTVINWIRTTDPSRFEMHLTCFANPGGTELPFVAAAQRASVPVVGTIPWSRSKPLFSAARKLRELVLRHRIDIIHSHNCYADVLAAIVRLIVPVKLVTTLYVWGDFGWKRNLLQRVNEWAIRRFDLISAHCEITRDQTIARGFKPAEVRLLISGFESHRAELSPRERAERRKPLGAGEADIVLANVARFYPEKAQDGLLRSFQDLSRRYPAVRLWMLGVGPLESQLRQLVVELGLQDRVHFLGFVENLPEVLALVDIQVHPSHMEGVAISICSGMAAGLPIVASNVGGLPEVLKHGETGILVPPGDERGFTEAVSDLIEHREKARRIGTAARHFIETEYSLARAGSDLAKAYQEVMQPCT